MNELELFQGLNVLDFLRRFSSEEECLKYLSYHKWANGFCCIKCEGRTFWPGPKSKPYNKVCKLCRHSESPTANTLFHKNKFGLVKAFAIAFDCSTTTKGFSSAVINKRYGINKNTAWAFMHKIRQAMKSSQNYPITGHCEVDEFYVGSKESGKTGRGAQKKKKVVVVIEKSGEFGIKRAYMRKIRNTSSDEIRPLFAAHISPEAKVLTDKWTAYTKLKADYNITQEKSVPKTNFILTNRFVQGVKSWIRTIYHHVSDGHFQSYLDEYCFRFNRNNSKQSIFDNLMKRMVTAKSEINPNII